MTRDVRQRLTHIVHAVAFPRTYPRLQGRPWRGRAQLLSLVAQWAQWEGLRVSEQTIRGLLSRPPSRRRRADCLDCGINTTAIGHYPYHLRDDLWFALVPGGRGMLCLDCLEVRLGRPLRRTDFHR
jgi:hypothetical protein